MCGGSGGGGNGGRSGGGGGPEPLTVIKNPDGTYSALDHEGKPITMFGGSNQYYKENAESALRTYKNRYPNGAPNGFANQNAGATPTPTSSKATQKQISYARDLAKQTGDWKALERLAAAETKGTKSSLSREIEKLKAKKTWQDQHDVDKRIRF